MGKETLMEKPKTGKLAFKLDKIGFTTSALCAIHCALMPFAITFLPVIGLGFLANPWTEVFITVLSIVIGVSSLAPSYVRFHRNLMPLALLLLGFTLIAATHFFGFHAHEPILMPIGGFALASAHYINWKLSKTYHGHARIKK